MNGTLPHSLIALRLACFAKHRVLCGKKQKRPKLMPWSFEYIKDSVFILSSRLQHK